jgi:hypothetical protein
LSSRSRALFTLFAMTCGAPVCAQSADADSAMARYRAVTSVVPKRCDKSGGRDEIIVCAEDQTRYRLPLPDERTPRDGPRRATGEVVAASSERVFAGQCGIVQGERICGKGVKVFSTKDGFSDAPLVLQALDKLINPNSQVGNTPVPIPEQYRGSGAR